MKVVYCFILLVFLIIPNGLRAQTQETNVTQKGGKTLVKIPVIVSDRDGRRISNLSKDDFEVYQAGVRQNIASFAAEDEPISVALLLDTSGSTQGVLNNIKDAARDFIDLLNPKDQCMIATFDSKINILTPFTSDQDALKKSLDKIQTAEREGSVVLNALDQISQKSFDRVQGRKAIVLLSDGKDLGSDVTRKELVDKLEESDVSIYPIFYQSGIGFNKPIIDSTGKVAEGKEAKKLKKQIKPKKRKKVYTITIPLPEPTYTPEEIKLIDQTATSNALTSLKELSDTTAGRLYQSNDEKLSQIFRQVAAELRQQYLIGFYLDGTANSNDMRDINIKTTRPNVVVNARTQLRAPKN